MYGAEGSMPVGRKGVWGARHPDTPTSTLTLKLRHFSARREASTYFAFLHKISNPRAAEPVFGLNLGEAGGSPTRRKQIGKSSSNMKSAQLCLFVLAGTHIRTGTEHRLLTAALEPEPHPQVLSLLIVERIFNRKRIRPASNRMYNCVARQHMRNRPW